MTDKPNIPTTGDLIMGKHDEGELKELLCTVPLIEAVAHLQCVCRSYCWRYKPSSNGPGLVENVIPCWTTQDENSV